MRDDFLVPIYRREALWIGFDGAWWKPNAVKVGVGNVDALTGGAFDEVLCAEPQNYLVVPDQPWLDGINAGHETVRQFVAMPLGSGMSVRSERSAGAHQVASGDGRARGGRRRSRRGEAGAALAAELAIRCRRAHRHGHV